MSKTPGKVAVVKGASKGIGAAIAKSLAAEGAHSLRIDPDMLVVTASPARTALKISQLTRQLPGGMPPAYDSIY